MRGNLFLRQGWERLYGEAKAVFFVPAAGARSARDHGAGFTKTGLSQTAFERTARRRHVNAPPEEPKVKAGGRREREQPGALKKR